MLSVAISIQQLLLGRAKGEKRGGFYFSDIGKNNLSFTVPFSGLEGPFESHYRMTALLYRIKKLH